MPSRTLQAAMARQCPLQIPGSINAYCALLAETVGFEALYLSGAGVANASLGVPDLAMTSLNDVVEEVRRISGASDLPLLVDADTGWGSAFNIARTTRELIRAGAAGMHIEDQEQAKRCGHRPNKSIVSTEEMCDQLRSAVDARSDPNFVVMARTDAFAHEGQDASIERVRAYIDAGADMIFAEALYTLDDYKAFTSAVDVPVLANITEFGLTPCFTLEELRGAGIAIALYPLSAFRAMSNAALNVYRTILEEGSQKTVLDTMQTREELYEVLDYHSYEEKLDQLNASREKNK